MARVYPNKTERRWMAAWATAQLMLSTACPSSDAVPVDPARLAASEAALDAFYAWDRAALDRTLGAARGAEAMRYYQSWAEAAHYRVLERRPCVPLETDIVRCRVTVRDDFGTTLGYTATDTFRFRFDTERLVDVEFEGDDPWIFTGLFVWMGFDRPEVFEEACVDLFAGGETPAECARAVAAAAQDFVAWLPVDIDSDADRVTGADTDP